MPKHPFSGDMQAATIVICFAGFSFTLTTREKIKVQLNNFLKNVQNPTKVQGQTHWKMYLTMHLYVIC